MKKIYQILLAVAIGLGILAVPTAAHAGRVLPSAWCVPGDYNYYLIDGRYIIGYRLHKVYSRAKPNSDWRTYRIGYYASCPNKLWYVAY